MLERRLLPQFGLDLQPDALAIDLIGSGDSLLLGSKDDVLIPVTLYLRDVALETTGIVVCGVASRMAASSSSGSMEDREKHQTGETDSRFDRRFERSEGPEERRVGTHNLHFAQDTCRSDTVEISFLSITRADMVIVRAAFVLMNEYILNAVGNKYLKFNHGE